MNWLSFFIGVLVGWLIGWLIDYFFCRPRRLAAEAELKNKLAQCDEERAALKAQLAGYQDRQVRLDGANTEIDTLKAQLAGTKGLQADLVSCKARSTELELELERLKAELASRASAPKAAAATVATAAAGIVPTALAAEPVTPDDLILIEGIGPKINALLNQDGIYTFAQLAAATVARLQSILDAAGPRFRLADPKTWPEQAALARDGKWDAFGALQATLKAGRKA